MTQGLGFVVAAAQLSYDSILVRPKRSIGPFVAQVTIEEVHRDDLEITDHPVEQGAIIADHAYKRPAEVIIRCGWSNSPTSRNIVDGVIGGLRSTVDGVQGIVTGNTPSQVRDIYAKLLKLQAERVPFSVFTGKRVYSDMLLRSVVVTTDKDSENALMVVATLRQVIMVQTRTITVAAPPERQADPSATTPTTNSGSKTLTPSTKFDAAGGGRGFEVVTP